MPGTPVPPSSAPTSPRRIASLLALGIVAIGTAAWFYVQSLQWVPAADAKVKAAQAAAAANALADSKSATSQPSLEPPAPTDPNALRQYAHDLLEHGRPIAAILPAEQAAKLEPNNPASHLLLGIAYATTGYANEAMGSYRIVLKLDPMALEAYQRLGDLQEALGDTKGAESTYKQARDRAPTNSGPLMSLANLYHAHNESEKVLSILAPLLKTDAAPVAALYMSGKAYQNMGKSAEAEAYLTRAIQNSDFADAYHALGSIHVNSGKYEDGIKELRKAVSLQPSNSLYHYALGNALRSNITGPEITAEARDEFEAALEIDPGFTIAHYYYGLMLEQTGKPEAALREYRLTLRQSPEFLAAGYRMGIVFRALGQIAESKQYMEKFGKASKQEISQVHGRRRDNSFVDTAEAHISRAQAFLKEGLKDKAIAALKAALERDPSNGLARRMLREQDGKGQ